MYPRGNVRSISIELERLPFCYCRLLDPVYPDLLVWLFTTPAVQEPFYMVVYPCKENKQSLMLARFTVV